MITVEGIIASGPLFVALPHWDININCVVLFVICEVQMSLTFIIIGHKTWFCTKCEEKVILLDATQPHNTGSSTHARSQR